MIEIPDFNPLYEQVKEYIKTHQGEKGYIDTQMDTHTDCDSIYGFVFDEGEERAVEVEIVGVMYDKNEDEIGVAWEHIHPRNAAQTIYGEEDFKQCDWCSLRYSDIYFISTLLSIAECIEQYA